jgi:membrane associated rhomboid family serine protease
MTFSLRPITWNEMPPVTRGLAFAFLCGWVLELAFGHTVNFYLGLVPLRVMGFGWLWQTFTYMFIHAGFVHFLFNTLMLWMLGAAIEPELGSRRFLAYFLFCGVAAGLLTTFVSPGSTRSVIGASGAVYGLLYAFAALYPEQTVFMYFLFPMTARQFVVVMAALSLALSFATPNSGVANFTHLSGLGAGWIYFRLRKITDLQFPDLGLSGRIHRLFLRLFRPSLVENDDRVDDILAKISRYGEQYITAEERRALDEYAKKKGGKA